MSIFEYNGEQYEAEPGETVLSCLLRLGISIENSCQAGVCQSCSVRLVEGKPDPLAQHGLSRAQKERGIVLSCQQKAAENLRLTAADAAPTVHGTVEKVDFRSDTIAVVRIRAEEPLSYSAGQFYHVMKDDGTYRSYSAASLPGNSHLVLHVRVMDGGEVSPWLTQGTGTRVRLRGSYGGCTYVGDDDERDTPLVLAGVGTGAAPLFGVLQQAIDAGHRGPIVFLHGSRQARDLYLRSELDELAATQETLTLSLSALDVGDGEDGVEAVPVDQLLRQQLAPLLAGEKKPFLYLCGDPTLVKRMKRDAYLAGLNLDRILSDPFVPPPEVLPKNDA